MMTLIIVLSHWPRVGTWGQIDRLRKLAAYNKRIMSTLMVLGRFRTLNFKSTHKMAYSALGNAQVTGGGALVP